jgi:O-antigen/teichoic acid export membrane protein
MEQAGSALAWKALQLGGAKAIFLARLVILARLVSPEDFGLLAIGVSSVGFLLTVTETGMIPALVQSQEVDEDRYNVAWTVTVARALLIGGAMLLAAPLVAQVFGEPRAVPIIRALALRPVLEALASIKVAKLTRELRFRPLATLKLVEALANAVLSIALAPALGVWALVVGVLAGAAASLLVSYWLAPHRPRLILDSAATRPLVQFGRWVFVTSVVAMVGSYTLRVVITRQLGVAELGLYFLAAQLAFLPGEVAREVVGAVAFPLYARLQSDLRQAAAAFRAMLTSMSALLFPSCALIVALAPALVNGVLGSRWAGTAPVIQVLGLATLVGVFGEATGPIFRGLGQPHNVTIVELVQSLGLAAFAWVLSGRFGLLGAGLAWLPALFLSLILNVVLIHRILPLPLSGLGRPLLAVSGVSAIAALVAVAAHTLLPGLPGLILASLLAAAVVAGLFWTVERSLAPGIIGQVGLIFPWFAQFSGRLPAEAK